MRKVYERGLLLLLSGAAAVTALGVKWRIFPDGSPNLDELAYLSQAEALRRGTLTLETTTHRPNLMPYLSGAVGDRVVFKYQPGWPAVLAASKSLTGTYTTALAIVAASVPLVAYWFAYESSARRRVALIASLVVTLSPLTIVQSATFLGYMPAAVALAASAAAVLRGCRTNSGRWLVLGGAILGLAFFHRPFDAVLWSLPLLCHLVVSFKARGLAVVVRRIMEVAAGVAPGAVALGGYNWIVMGSPLVPAFQASGAIDTFGFGRRASFEVPGRPGGLLFTPAGSVHASWHYLTSLSAFTVGGWLFLAAGGAGLAVCLRRRSFVVGALALVIPMGYVFWWGVANAVEFGLDRSLGPFYWLPALMPLSLLAAVALVEIPEGLVTGGRHVPAADSIQIASIGLLLAVTISTGRAPLAEARLEGHRRSVSAALTAPSSSDASITFVPPEFPGDPYVRAVVPPDPPGSRHLIALSPDGVRSGRLPLAAALPGRRLYEVAPHRELDGIFNQYQARRRELTMVSANRMRLEVVYSPSGTWQRGTFYMRLTGGLDQTIEHAVHHPSHPSSWGFDLREGTGSKRDGGGIGIPHDGRTHFVHVGVTVSNGPALTDGRVSFECVWEVMVMEGDSGRPRLLLLDPPRTRHYYVFPQAQGWSDEDVEPRLSCAVRRLR